jgi:hypothetical protein
MISQGEILPFPSNQTQELGEVAQASFNDSPIQIKRPGSAASTSHSNEKTCGSAKNSTREVKFSEEDEVFLIESKEEMKEQQRRETKEKDKPVFWVQNPNVLLAPRHVYEIFPTSNLAYHDKMNALTRLIIILTIVGLCISSNKIRILLIGGLCILAIILLEYTQNRDAFTLKDKDLGVGPVADAVIAAFGTEDPAKIGKHEFFDQPKASNPYNNVLVTDIVDNPQKLPAPPAYYPQVEKAILDATKEAVQKMNPTFPDLPKKLFSSLDDHFEFEQSARQFVSNPSTTIPNDQGAFAQFCYGEMISCKEGNMFACARDAPRHNLY